ncbi:MAG: periplasmic heavy metal sensor [Thermodesulfovibrionales bacterium]|nr:periplasmic heavy metal sensor [Thermodesulfovibrionales bacterium]
MKKYKIPLIIIAVLLSLTTSALAFGPGFTWGGGKGFCYLSSLAPEQAQKFAELQKQLLPLRQKMLELKTDLAALYSQPNLDWNAIASKQQEITDLRIEIQKRTYAAGFTTGPCFMQNAMGKLRKGNCFIGQGYRMM